ncbi:DNA end-binding protein Ku [Actinopolyspora biskrensis]|uniref:Non-homologous end joining protein Ku n=1 Tax=Actinopolyspora biskrensis TaxID=1470178 RepID=A0A852Z6X3_9ACTN|nr:Ku protein [Actinopolyspora biskrensis]NYH81135.1 DNA end-binding protein Ku [Actinopolyspora biskrensis]
MPQKIWNGSITFGLVTIPVGLYSATEDHSVHFNQYERGTHDRVRHLRINERTGEQLRAEDVVKGRDVGGTLVTVEQRELDELVPLRSRTIEIEGFVELSEIDPVHFHRTYWLAPTEEQQDRPYRLLHRAMLETRRAGIATLVLHGREYLTAIRATDRALALNTLFFLDEVRDPPTAVGPPREDARSGRELQLAIDLIRSMSEPWRPDRYTDTYTSRVEQLLVDKAAGRAPRPESEPAEPSEVPELTEALRRSTERAGRVGDPASGAAGGATAPARETSESVSTLSRDELRRRARELNIKGRSKLNRAQLERAVTERPATHREEPSRGSRSHRPSESP